MNNIIIILAPLQILHIGQNLNIHYAQQQKCQWSLPTHLIPLSWGSCYPVLKRFGMYSQPIWWQMTCASSLQDLCPHTPPKSGLCFPSEQQMSTSQYKKLSFELWCGTSLMSPIVCSGVPAVVCSIIAQSWSDLEEGNTVQK